MNIIINGHPKRVENVGTVAELVQFLGYEGKRVAIERNGDIVPKSLHGEALLAENDQIEIVVAVGGG